MEQQGLSTTDTGQKESVFRIFGLDCADCAGQLEAQLSRVRGISDVSLNFGTARLRVRHSIPSDSVKDIVRKAGYDAQPADSTDEGVLQPWRTTMPRLVTTILSGLLIILVWTLGSSASWQILTALYSAAIFVGGIWTFRRALTSMRLLVFDMNVMMTIAVIGAVIIGEWTEGAIIAFLFSLSNFLESYTMERTRRSIRSLLEGLPRQASVIRDGLELNLPVEEIAIGETVIVRPGERIALDGTILKGETSVDQSSITGESIPQDKNVGDDVFAGTLNGQGSFDMTVTRKVGDTLYDRIIHLVEEAQAKRTPSQAFVDRFAAIYTPLVLALVALIATIPPLLFGQLWNDWIYRALALLLVACPCALILATPVAVISAIGTATRQGLLIKGGAVLEQVGSVATVAFDKTGTLTRGIMTVQDVIPAQGVNEESLIRLAGSIERRSEHPIGRAILERAHEMGLDPDTPDTFEALPGKGVLARIDGESYCVGNERLFESMDISLDGLRESWEALQKRGSTVMLLGGPGGILGLIGVADEIRSNSRFSIQALREGGIRNIVMLSGDNAEAAHAVGASLGIEDIRAGLLPEDKVEEVRRLIEQYGPVVMVGDGINDAPALATATVGIAMGRAGTDTALETADIVLMSDDLSKLPWLTKLSKKTVRIIKQNIAFAIIIKVVAVSLIIPGWLTLWIAVLSDMGASLLVTLNGLRLLKNRF